VGTQYLHLTIRYMDAGDGWFTAQLAEIPGAISGTREEARGNVLDALEVLLTPDEQLAGEAANAVTAPRSRRERRSRRCVEVGDRCSVVCGRRRPLSFGLVERRSVPAPGRAQSGWPTRVGF
jgi:hypothetical protein